MRDVNPNKQGKTTEVPAKNLRNRKEKGAFFFSFLSPRSPLSPLLHASYSSFDSNFSQIPQNRLSLLNTETKLKESWLLLGRGPAHVCWS